MTEVVSPGPNLLSPETEAAASSPVRTSDPVTERSSPPVRTSDPVTGVISPVRTSSPETEAAASSPVRTSLTERSSPPVRTSSPSAPPLPSFSPSLLRESSTPQDRPASPLSSSSASLSEPPLNIKQPRVMLSKLLVNDHCSLSISSSPGVSQSSGPLLSTPPAPPPPPFVFNRFLPTLPLSTPSASCPTQPEETVLPQLPVYGPYGHHSPPPPTTTPRRPSQPPHLQLLAPAETGPPLHHQDLQGGGEQGSNYPLSLSWPPTSAFAKRCSSWGPGSMVS